MPSVSEYQSVEVEFEWCDVITKRTNDSDITELAEAIVKAGKGDAMIKAICAEKTGSKQPMTGEGLFYLETEVDHLINDFLRGMPINDALASIARHHFNRIIPPGVH